MEYTSEMPPAVPCMYYDDKGSMKVAFDVKEANGAYYGHIMSEETRKKYPDTAVMFQWNKIEKWKKL